MGIADEFERRLERIVEGAFSKAFRSDIEPAEIGRRLVRDMEAGKSVSVGAVYVPNTYTISLSPGDYERLEGLLPQLKTEFATLLKGTSRERMWKPSGPIEIRFASDKATRKGRFEVRAAHEASATADDESKEPEAELATSENRWPLTGDVVSIGRLETNDVQLIDQSVSRTHAQVVKRDDGWWIVDLDSTGGTFVNDGRVKERRLQPGDKLMVGPFELEFKLIRD